MFSEVSLMTSQLEIFLSVSLAEFTNDEFEDAPPVGPKKKCKMIFIVKLITSTKKKCYVKVFIDIKTDN